MVFEVALGYKMNLWLQVNFSFDCYGENRLTRHINGMPSASIRKKAGSVVRTILKNLAIFFTSGVRRHSAVKSISR